MYTYLRTEHEDNVEFSTLFYDERVGDYGRAELREHVSVYVRILFLDLYL